MVRLWSNPYSGVPQHTDEKSADDLDEDELNDDAPVNRQEATTRWSRNKALILSVAVQLILFFTSTALFVAASLKSSDNPSTAGVRGGRSSEREHISSWILCTADNAYSNRQSHQ